MRSNWWSRRSLHPDGISLVLRTRSRRLARAERGFPTDRRARCILPRERPVVRRGNPRESRADLSASGARPNGTVAESRSPVSRGSRLDCGGYSRYRPKDGRVGKSRTVLPRCARIGSGGPRTLASTRALAQSGREKPGSRVRLRPGSGASVVGPTALSRSPKPWHYAARRGRVNRRTTIWEEPKPCPNPRYPRDVMRRFGRSG